MNLNKNIKWFLFDSIHFEILNLFLEIMQHLFISCKFKISKETVCATFYTRFYFIHKTTIYIQ